MVNFNYLVRFEDENGVIHFGEAGAGGSEGELVGRSVPVYTGEAPYKQLQLSGSKATIAKVLCPLADTPLIHGVGLNYKAHAEEGNVTMFDPSAYQQISDMVLVETPASPNPLCQISESVTLTHAHKGLGGITVLTLPDALAGPYEDIPINKEAWQLDYEGELCVIIGKECKNVSASEDPLDYVLGYSIGNDVSSRYWQDKTRSGGQHGYGKSMDKFAPVGPVIVSKKVIPDPSQLAITTHVNGEQRQHSSTGNMIFDIPTLIRHLSRGITLQPGTIIMTGTPEGVAAFIKPSPWLKNGDTVEIEISKIGKIRNKMVFEDENNLPVETRPPGF